MLGYKLTLVVVEGKEERQVMTIEYGPYGDKISSNFITEESDEIVELAKVVGIFMAAREQIERLMPDDV